MNDFDYEVKERRNLANQARHRKRGSKSKKCTLPSDGMTHKQWKERNGEILSYNLSKPMSWEQFKALPKDIQQQYIKGLQAKYNASLAAISTMFGKAPCTVGRHLKCHEISISDGDTRPKFSKAQKDAWSCFCKGETEPEQEAVTPPADAEQPEEPAASSNPVKIDFGQQSDAEAPREEPKRKGMQLDNFVLNFSGGFDPDMIRNSLAMILERGQQVEITISCYKREA